MTSNDWIQLMSVFWRARGAGQAAGLVHGPRLRRQAVRTGPRAGLAGTRHLSRWRHRSQARKWAGGKYAVAVLLFNAHRFPGGLRACCDCKACCRSIRKDFAANTPDLAFNTAASFATNTNWQSYGGETTLSYLSQMLGLTVQNFVSAATGMAVLVALIRGLARRSATTIGNFWYDLVRSTLYILMPLSIVLALVLVSQGVIQNFKPYDTANVLQPIAGADGTKLDDAIAGDGPGRVADCDQATGHQRRRVLQRELGPSVRESDAAVELPRAAVDSADLGRHCVTRSA